MLSTILHEHFRRIAELYSQITPGQNLTSPEDRSPAEISLLDEISSARKNLRESIFSLGRPRPIHVATGQPKGSWAHIYYASFHDPKNSRVPTEGFYPAFLMSVDQRQCWLAVVVAAASVGISGRGGWSIRRGAELRKRAQFLGRNLPEQNNWQKGPITLGPDGSGLHAERGSNRPAGRAYECGAIISKCFNPHDPPHDLDEWLRTAFLRYDDVFRDESVYIQTSMPHLSPTETHEQANAAITGEKAEKYFMDWAPSNHPEWGEPVSRTDRVGLGFDIEFPEHRLKVEVKGCRGRIENIRMTECEWAVAERTGSNYVLAVVSHLDTPDRVRVTLIRDPFQELRGVASEQRQLQVTYTIPRNSLRQNVNEDDNWFQ